MAARRCSLCGIDFPTTVTTCPVCHDTTDWMNSAVPDPDWEHEVELRNTVLPSTEAQRVERWRLKTILDLGYTVDVAESLAVSDADLHVLASLIGHGCTLELAARIV